MVTRHQRAVDLAIAADPVRQDAGLHDQVADEAGRTVDGEAVPVDEQAHDPQHPRLHSRCCCRRAGRRSGSCGGPAADDSEQLALSADDAQAAIRQRVQLLADRLAHVSADDTDPSWLHLGDHVATRRAHVRVADVVVRRAAAPPGGAHDVTDTGRDLRRAERPERVGGVPAQPVLARRPDVRLVQRRVGERRSGPGAAHHVRHEHRAPRMRGLERRALHLRVGHVRADADAVVLPQDRARGGRRLRECRSAAWAPAAELLGRDPGDRCAKRRSNGWPGRSRRSESVVRAYCRRSCRYGVPFPADAAVRRIRCKIRANRDGHRSGARATASLGAGVRADRGSSRSR